jgi:hypothetical protein
LVPVGSRGRYKEMIKEVECSRNFMYSCVKMKKMRYVETITGMGEE